MKGKNLMRIVSEGYYLANFNSEPAMTSWAEQRVGHPRQKKQVRCKQRGNSKRAIGLISQYSGDNGHDLVFKHFVYKVDKF